MQPVCFWLLLFYSASVLKGNPDAKKIENKIHQITALQVNLRIDSIRKVGEAVSSLSPDQIKILIVSNNADD